MRKKLIRFILDLLYPPRCVFCHRILLPGESGPCCTDSLPRAEADKYRRGSAFTVCASVLLYQDCVRESLHRYKFSGMSAYASQYGELLADCIRENFCPAGQNAADYKSRAGTSVSAGKVGIVGAAGTVGSASSAGAAGIANQASGVRKRFSYDIITWVPVSPKRLRERGYDQAKLLAESAGEKLGERPEGLLVKKLDTQKQSLTGNRSKRRQNIQKAYEVPDTGAVAGKRILLIDDIVTTGSTLEECAATLKAAGAAEVLCATLAMASR